MSITKDTIIYNDWSGGSWGSNGPFDAALQSPKLYRGLNLQVYANGSLGPRPGWKVLASTGPPAPTTTVSLYGMWWVPDPTLTYGWLLFAAPLDAGATKRLNLDASSAWASTIAGAIGQTVDGTTEGNSGSMVYLNPQNLVLGATTIYNITNNTSGTITYPSAFVPARAVFYKDRMYSWGDATYPNRIYYSDAGAFSTFTAGNFFDVGSGGATAASRPKIRGIYNVKDGLLIVTTTTANQIQPGGDWWLLQGPNAVTGSLKRIGSGIVPLYPNLATEFSGAVVAMDFSSSRGSLLHDGASLDLKTLSRIRPGGEIYAFGAGRNPITTYGETSIIMPYVVTSTKDPTRTSISDPVGEAWEDGLQAWEFVHGVWTKALWWNGALDKTVEASQFPFLWATTAFQGDKMICATNDTVDGLSGTWRFFTRDICLDRPARSSDTWSSGDEVNASTAGAGVNAQLWLADERAPQGGGIRVRRVTVDFDYWKEATYSPASIADMTCKVRYRGLKDSIAKYTSTLPDGDSAAAFSFLPATTGRVPSRGRYTFQFPEEAFYGEFQVIFPTLRNVAIHDVVVDVEIDPNANGWS